MKLVKISYDISNKNVNCLVEYRPTENVVSHFVIAIPEWELLELNPDWWETECKQILNIRLNEELQ